MTEVELRGAFIDIRKGYSVATWRKKTVFIRHFSHYEQFETELERERCFNLARSKGIQTKEEKIKWLFDNDLWDKKKDVQIRDLTLFVENLKKSKLKAITKLMADDYQKQIDENESVLNGLVFEKNHLIGLTAEAYAEQKLYPSYIYASFYKNDSLTERFFTETQFKRLDDDELDEIYEIYFKFIQKFSIENVKKISISGFFTSYFYLAEDMTKFFGKPICDLTYNQINLLSYGSYFRRLLGELGESVSEEVKKDPEKIEEYFNRKNNVKSVVTKGSGNGRTAIIGATEKDDGAFIGGVKDDTLSKGEIETAFEGLKSGKIKMRR